VRIDAAARRVVIGPRAALAVGGVVLRDPNWLGTPHGGIDIKVRSMAPLAGARLDGDRVTFDVPQFGVSPGQAAVIYAASRVLGGGWIAATTPPIEARQGVDAASMV